MTPAASTAGWTPGVRRQSALVAAALAPLPLWFVMANVLGGVAASLMASSDAQSLVGRLVSSGSLWALTGVTMALAVVGLRAPWGAFGLRVPRRPTALLTGAALGLAVAGVSVGLGLAVHAGWSHLLGAEAMVQVTAMEHATVNAELLRPLLSAGGLLSLVDLCVFTPLVEEWFFRGLVFGGLRPLGAGWAIAGTAVLFAGLHAIPSGFDAPSLLIGGLALGALRERTGSVWPGVALHGAYNAAVIGAVLVGWV